MVGATAGPRASLASVIGGGVRASADTSPFRVKGMGCLHVGATALTTLPGGSYMVIAIDRALMFVHAELHDRIDADVGAAFLRSAAQTFPYRIHTVFTDRGASLADPPAAGRTPGVMTGIHLLDRTCWDLNIVHRRRGRRLPWTRNTAGETGSALLASMFGLIARGDLDNLKADVLGLVKAHNFSRPQESLGWRTPFQAMFDAWNDDPSRFRFHPRRLMPKPRLAHAARRGNTNSALI
jgi:hypothetical protein